MTNIYRGQANLVHIRDGERRAIGQRLAADLSARIRDNAGAWDDRKLCPGCYMVAVLNCAIELARLNGQSLTELGNSLGDAFKQLAMDGGHAESLESIEVALDSEPCTVAEFNSAWLDAHERAS